LHRKLGKMILFGTICATIVQPASDNGSTSADVFASECSKPLPEFLGCWLNMQTVPHTQRFYKDYSWAPQKCLAPRLNRLRKDCQSSNDRLTH
jgi:hypothetical protein